MKKTLDHIYAVVEHAADLPASGVPDKLYVVRTDETAGGGTILYHFDGSKYNPMSGGIGGSDPSLNGRVTAIENAMTTATHVFKEDFISQNRIDFAKTDASVGTGYVRTDRLASFQEDYSTTNYVDIANSTNISVDTANKKLALAAGNLSGVALSKSIPTTGTKYATLSASVRHKEELAFSGHTKLSQSYPQSWHMGTAVVVDRSSRTWHFWFISSVGIYLRCTNEDGKIAYDGLVLQSTDFVYHANGYSSSIAVDYSNRIWLSAVVCSASVYRSILYGFNPDFTSVGSWPLLSNSSNYVGFTSLYLDRYDHLWVYYGANVNSAYNNFQVYDVSQKDISLHVTQTERVHGGITMGAVKIVYDSTRDRMIFLGHGTGGGHAIRSSAWSISGAQLVSSVSISLSSATVHSINAVYDAKLDRIIVFSFSSGKIHIVHLNPQTLTQVWAGVINDSLNCVDAPISVLISGDAFMLAYSTTADSAQSRTIHVIGVDAYGVTVVPDMLASGNISNHYHPTIYRSPNGTIKVAYSTLRYGTTLMIEDASYQNVSSTVEFHLSNDGGTTWRAALSDQQIEFPTVGSQLRIRAALKAPQLGFSPEILSYSITEGNNSTNPGTTRTFISTSLPSVSPVGKAVLAADTDVSGGGIIEWYVANDGGYNWKPAIPGQTVSFPDLNSDLRVKAILHYPILASKPPVITGYNVASYSSIVQSDLDTLQQNLALTNFKVDTLSAASKNNMVRMFIDAFNDDSGIDAARSSFVTINGTVRGGLRDISPKMTGPSTPAPFVVKQSGQYSSYAGWYMFDDSDTSYWYTYTAPKPAGGHWASIDLGRSCNIVSFRIMPGNISGGSNGLKDFELYGSNDESAWTQIHKATNPNNLVYNNYVVSNPGFYRYYRLNVLTSYFQPDNALITSLVLQEGVDGTVVSKAEHLPIQPSFVILTAVDTGNPKYYISRDDGMSWMEVAKGKTTSLAGLPAGSRLRYKIETGNDSVQAIGVAWR
ncbi:discoidin domain-containing protein [Paenibacillus sp. NPDC058071]|uniref:discoidin domain-containing protein n=1 Tax=Paenibacillus sp. NPDC058071 TaxID=3346326 RepID=UPI0036DC1D62